MVGHAAHGQLDQSLPASTITSSGEASIETAPDRAEFWLYFKVTGTTLEEAAQKIKNIQVNTLRLLKDREITPLETVFTAPNIPDANTRTVTFAMRVQFTVGRLATGVDEPVFKIAELCDAMRGVAEHTDALLTGPILNVSQKKDVERNAIMRAMENALPHAEAAAESMSTDIATILDVRVVQVAWNQEPDYAADQPDSQRAVCQAKVDVVYVLK
ncbi:MAG: SIMPL domain-containing protein [Candidatus Hydrogenedentota bacterium]